MSELQVIAIALAAFFVGAMHGFHIGWLKYGRKITLRFFQMD